MEPKEIKEAVLYLNGEEIGPIQDIQETSLASTDGIDECWKLGIDWTHGQDHTVTFSLRLDLPYVNRKRFVRHLQKYGYSKKQAKKIAWKCHAVKYSYKVADYLIQFGAIQQIFPIQ